MPVLVIVGRYDGGVEPLREVAARVPHGRFDEFEDSAHFPYAEEPGKFAADVTGFLGAR